MEISACNVSAVTFEEYNDKFNKLDGYCRGRVTRYKRQDDRIRSLFGLCLAKNMISSYKNLPLEEIKIRHRKNGKPFAEKLDIFFNISHSYDFSVCAVADFELGIDIEKIRPINIMLTKKFCSDKEIKYILQDRKLDDFVADSELDRDILVRFFEIWTAKEAFLKLNGNGISCDLKAFEVTDEFGHFKLNGVCFDKVFVSDDYICTVAYGKK